jgi:transcription elongation factor Elf1
LSETKKEISALNTKKICDTCELLLEVAFNLKKLHNSHDFKCENCGRQTAIGALFEITAKKGAMK